MGDRKKKERMEALTIDLDLEDFENSKTASSLLSRLISSSSSSSSSSLFLSYCFDFIKAAPSVSPFPFPSSKLRFFIQKKTAHVSFRLKISS
ncbi:hypothetical protein V6N13_111042 [Hibiscus sabdariffa]|uniref:Uncharacterized protein n=1 Tax=Hibiscus sabdariffa TaxID=183260 RepID=A0ABR2TJD2_9ROSI